MNRLGIFAVSAAVGLAACSDTGGAGAAYSAADAKAGAAFRFHARDAFGGLNPVCSFTENADLLARYEPLQLRYDTLTERISNTAFATDLTAVRADYDYYWSRNKVECGAMDTAETEKAVGRELERVANALSDMERAVGGA